MSAQAQRLYEFGPFQLDPDEHRLLEDGRHVPLTPKAFQTLLVLVENQGRVLEKDDLLKKVWPDTFVEEATLAQNIFTLRKQLHDGRAEAVYIETIPKRGYRFAAPVRLVELPPKDQWMVSGPEEGASKVLRSPRRWVWIAAAAVVLAAAAGVYLSYRRSPSASHRAMLVVLPVQNLTGDTSRDYVTDGLTEEVIADLGSANPQRLGVIARTSAMGYKQTHKTVQAIARELGVDYVLESSLREGPGHVRFTAQLIRTRDQTHVWAHNYDRPVTDLLALQVELARTVADEIRVGITPERAARMASTRPVRPEAYDAYLKGRFFWNKRTPEAMKSAEEYFQQATRADPTFAPAYAGLADCYQVMVNLAQISAKDGFTRARAAALKALEIDNTLAEAHTSLASIKGDYDWDWSGAEAEYKHALELNPNYATAHHWYAEFLAGMGRFDEATDEISKAREIDPLSPVIGVTVGQMYCRTGQCEPGIQQLKKTLEVHPDFAEAHEALAEIYAYRGMYGDSLAELAKDPDPPAGHAVVLAGYAAAKAGRKPEALTALRQLQSQPDLPHRDCHLADLYAALGDKDRAFANLESARQGHDSYLPYFRADFLLQDLRSDPRYAELIARMNMPR